MGVKVKAYAKLNLTLAVTGVSGGYHMLDSLVCSVDLFDYIVLKKRKDGLISVGMHGMGLDMLPEEQNNAYKAAQLYQRTFGTGGADIQIYKNIPVGAGLGGSSADAAGTLCGLARLYGAGSDKQLKELAAELGSDTAYMLTGGYAVMRGRGEEITPIQCSQKLDFLLLVPPTGVSTAECYRLYDRAPCRTNTSQEALNALLQGDKQELGKQLNNALCAAACALNGDVATALGELEAFSPLGVNMTGSGSCAYALFPNDMFCSWAQSRYRGKFRCMRVKTVL